MKLSSKIQSVENCGDYLAIKTNGAQFQVYLLDNDIIRMRGLSRMNLLQKRHML